jgi:4-amino-4-deoxy-L-arabinose transferase-like glycosyltransferase
LEESSSSSKIDLFALLSVVIPFIFYLLTLAPSVTFFDSGEFLTAIRSLGSPHSPGYPLFVLYAKPFTWLPFGNIAFRVNVATAISAALACFGVYLLVRYLLEKEEPAADKPTSDYLKKFAGLAAALTFAFSARLWLQSNHDKPYPLLSFLSAMIFYLLFLWREKYLEGEEQPGYIYLCAFLCGLSFGAHQSMVLLIPSFAFLVLSVDVRLIARIKEQILACAFFLLGFSVYLYLPIRATRNPLLNWGDPKTIMQFLWHFLRKGYPAEKVDRDLSLLLKQISAFNIVHEFTIVGFVILVIGIIAYAKKRQQEIIAYGIGICTFIAFIVGYQNTSAEMIFLTEEFYTPLYLYSSVFIGLGLFYLINTGLRELQAARIRTFQVKIIAGIFLFALPVTLCVTNYYENDQHENYIAYDYANNTFRSLSPNAVLFTWGDSGAFPLWYLQGVERMREDLVLLHTPHLVFTWYLDSFPDVFRSSLLRSGSIDQSPSVVLQMAIAEQMNKRPVYVDFSTRYSIQLDGYRLRERGICYQVERSSGGTPLPPDIRIWNTYTDRGLVDDTVSFRDLDTGKAILIYAISHMETGETLLSLRRVQEGFAELRKAEEIAPELQAQVRQIIKEQGANDKR